MDYQMKIVMVIDTVEKKNTIRNNLTSQLQTAFAAGTIKSWIMDISGILVPGEDNEEYSEGTT
uniref:Uncharacterized protein n=1 Tax=viral metagenome TaxID=1070528 RepID=A0A6M3LCF8_9ZZZZ